MCVCFQAVSLSSWAGLEITVALELQILRLIFLIRGSKACSIKLGCQSTERPNFLSRDKQLQKETPPREGGGREGFKQ